MFSETRCSNSTVIYSIVFRCSPVPDNCQTTQSEFESNHYMKIFISLNRIKKNLDLLAAPQGKAQTERAACAPVGGGGEASETWRLRLKGGELYKVTQLERPIKKVLFFLKHFDRVTANFSTNKTT